MLALLVFDLTAAWKNVLISSMLENTRYLRLHCTSTPLVLEPKHTREKRLINPFNIFISKRELFQFTKGNIYDFMSFTSSVLETETSTSFIAPNLDERVFRKSAVK